nr:trypsin-like peptidase domain-containing protein [Roseovarius sp. SCSIO 43702]
MRPWHILCIACLALPFAVRAEIPADRGEITLGFAPVVRATTPAVVNIYARRVVEAEASPFHDDPFFGSIFRELAPRRPRVQNSLGSGVILSADGLVVSNYHVVGGFTDIRVVLNDRREFDAEILLADEDSDLAILQLEGARDLAALELRDSDTVEVGDLVLAIGNPFGVGQTVSSGIISGLARSGLVTGIARGLFLQTDAPINPGNSGGALVDTQGRLVGVNTSILSRSGGSNGIGFAIPADMVAQFMAQARAGNTRFERPWVGAMGQPVTFDMAEALGLEGPYGVALTDLHEASPLREIGYGVGDVILAIDDAPVFAPEEVLYHLSVAGAGASVKVDGIVAGQRRSDTLRLTLPPDDPPRNTLTTGPQSAIPGLTLSTVNPAVQTERNLPLRAEGVILDDPGRVGARLGLREGDILRGVNGVEVRDAVAAAKALRVATRRLELVVERGGRSMVLRVRL